MKNFHLASRIFGVPLLIERQKLDAIVSALGPRLGLDPQAGDHWWAFGPGDPANSDNTKRHKPYYVTADGIGIVSIVGPLVKRDSGMFMSGGPTTYGEIESDFMDAATDPAIKGILLMIDSPGGESTGAMELSDMIHSQRGSKPIFAVADGMMFSAAYAIGSAADRIYVSQSSGVGSVGVWMLHVDQSEFDAKEGIKPTLIFAGAHKVDGNQFEPLSKEARATFQAEVDRIYKNFSDTVARNRGMSPKAVRATEAGLFWGQDGIACGFADQMGTFNDALAGLQARVKRGAMPMPEPNKMPMSETIQPVAETAAVETIAEVMAAVVAPAVSETIRRVALVYASEVIDLCVLAGMAQVATGFILADKPLEEIRTEVQTLRARADLEVAVQSRVLPETGADSKKPTKAQSPEEIEQSPIVKAARAAAAKANPKKE